MYLGADDLHEAVTLHVDHPADLAIGGIGTALAKTSLPSGGVSGPSLI